ncbi:4-hydroxy-tetrahydrodipicolinate synthase [Allosphingosinicella indica]|uniref:4-hydroxy-tetrahydrodipicolinate synthase n=1 Tax=Allosphingosinicella indica TaxID=941907 RepID=A0A1X7H3Q6_9SPHN|nr:4-hydroxy-tetrahydrodipicolinate synthase [Allosphingosinicella indica]SMF78864.1 4-hydroxy-tetrahydrodipicolinate synthase [Allosphingosinicella indica]
MFRGSIPALVTPFRDEAFDEGVYRDFVEWQIAEGTHGLVSCGTTGEASTLSFEEHFAVVAACVDQAKGRVPVIAGCGSNDTRVAVANVKKAAEVGADAVLLVPPYYNRPNQEGIYRHFEAVAQASALPVLLYNVPARTVTDIQVETAGRIVKDFPNIVGIKDATGMLGRVTAHRAACGPDFIQISGNDDTALGFMAMGGAGCISVTANVAPRLCADFQNACLGGEWAEALRLQDLLYPLHMALFTDASPGPVKYALTRVRKDFPSALRLPMTSAGEASRRAVDAALAHAGLT